ncbi:hypothetical protein M0657_004786 [Pyricularia oryzae]|uniref:Uncharacterized protein n=1 Tax=Pyricularia oryzae TaxID=318829 RepID=A0A4P7N3S2_PYROR|nr:hypothetical protein M9X92_004457 [Pyricularia oryzae]KAI7924115.1 hypothetical protein M0657_004786 [Pyricularia oryzae]QBZ54580.1 hypothetical protein PoMZ_10284 [Pyricularia oryzae]
MFAVWTTKAALAQQGADAQCVERHYTFSDAQTGSSVLLILVFRLDWAPKGWSKMAPSGFLISVIINTTLHPPFQSMIAVFKVTLDSSSIRCAADENRAGRCTGNRAKRVRVR